MTLLRISTLLVLAGGSLHAAPLPAPFVTSIDAAPPEGWFTAGGQSLTISGTDFGTDGVVTIGGTIASFSAYGDSSITITTPPGVGVDLPLVVEVSGQTSNPKLFSYNASAITSVTPPSGIAASGAEIVIEGTDFGQDEPTVSFGSEAATVTEHTDSSITVTKPVTVLGDSDIVVIQNGGQMSEVFPFTTLTSLPGYYVDADTAQVLPAPAGKYTDTTDALEPIPAEAGSYTPLAGMQGTIPASPGYFVTSEGSTTQSPVPAGSYTDTSGNTSGTDAPIGRYAPVPGMQSAIDASPGYYVDSPGSETQTPAPKGQYVALEGSSAASFADSGFYTPVPGMQSAIPASPGYYVDSQGMDEQTPANIGTFVANSGSTGAVVAPAGKYVPLSGMRGAIPAPEGTYSPSPGASTVLTIPAGFTTDAGSTSLVPLTQTQIVAYTLESNGDNSISFDSVSRQNYALFYTENLVDFTMLTTLAGTGGVVAHTFTPPTSSTGRRFYIVAPIDLPDNS